jgi:menaquinol-cytochrome c reductase iron-sulfur subunit
MPVDRDQTPEQPKLPLSRRQFLANVSILLGAFAAAMVGVPILGFIFSPLIQKTTRVWRQVGAVSDFQVGQTMHVVYLDATPLPWAGVAAKSAAWLRRDSETSFTAFSVNCTHLGCVQPGWRCGSRPAPQAPVQIPCPYQ